MNINQLLIITLILYIVNEIHQIEGFDGEINSETCLQRILDNGCITNDERESINNDCNDYTIPMPHGITNISCDNRDLYNWLICQQMMRNGACECQFGREQISSLCGSEPLNLSCSLRLSSPNNEVFDKIKELEEITLSCDNVEQREQKVQNITDEIAILLNDIENEKPDSKCIGNYISGILGLLIIPLFGLLLITSFKKNK